MFERFTDSSRRAVVLAQEEARLLNHGYIGTEHLLLGVLGAPRSVAARALLSMDVSLETARQQLEVVVGRGEQAPAGHIPFTRRGKKALELSLREALELRDNHIGTEHILLGIVREGEGTAVEVLTRLGVQLADLRERVLELRAASQHDPPLEGDPVQEDVSDDVSVSMSRGEASEAGDQPRCPRCNAAAADNLRATTVQVPHDAGEGAGAVTLLWCGMCGAVVAALRDEAG